MSVEQILSNGLVLGAVTLRGRALLAPLSGVTDVVFRRLAVRWGASAAVTEMVAAGPLLREEAEARLRSERAGPGPHIVQLVGREPAAMGAAARAAEDAGADVIDINFGCPAKKVTGGLAGAALMREPRRAAAIVEAVSNAVGCPVTAKMRLGWDRDSLNATDIARRAREGGAVVVTVHGRTRQDFYDGRADWHGIAAVREAVGCPVVANGDIDSVEAARRCLAVSGADAVMIGRAAVGQPWLVGRVAATLAGRRFREPDGAERAAIAREHYEGLLALYGRDAGLRHARKHLAAYADRAVADGFAVPSEDRATLVRSSDPTDVLAILGRLFDQPLRSAA